MFSVFWQGLNLFSFYISTLVNCLFFVHCVNLAEKEGKILSPSGLHTELSTEIVDRFMVALEVRRLQGGRKNHI